MIGLGKPNSSVRPMHAGDIVQCALCNVFLEVTKLEATRAAEVDELYYRLEAEIEARIHSMKYLYNENLGNDYWGILLLDAYNTFNEGNRKIIV